MIRQKNTPQKYHDFEDFSAKVNYTCLLCTVDEMR